MIYNKGSDPSLKKKTLINSTTNDDEFCNFRQDKCNYKNIDQCAIQSKPRK